MKRIIDLLFAIVCSVFRCSYKSLDNVYQEELPVSPTLVRETRMYKRLHRFVTLCILFKKYELILEVYEYTPRTVGRCIWNIFRDETRYIIYDINNSIFLAKWSRNRFIKVASIDKEVINNNDDDYDYEEEIIA